MPTEKIHQCRKCVAQIFWHKSERTGKFYPCDSADDRRDFHKCAGAQTQKPTAEKPVAPDFDPEPSLELRVAHLEQIVNNLIRTVKAVEARQPIDDQDVAF
jgi:hypothetical protein